MNTLLASWRRAWSAIASDDNDRLFRELVAAYGEPQRHYHTLQHLGECLLQVPVHSSLAVRPAEVELALWFHDAVYDVRAQDNEARSAAWLQQACRAAGSDAGAAARLCALVLVTRHTGVAADADQALLLDIDLSILGADAPRFDEYERQVREEYAWVPGEAYRERRCDVLAGFLARPSIFNTTAFRDRLERRARANLERSVAALQP